MSLSTIEREEVATELKRFASESLTSLDNKAKLLQRSETTVGWISRKNLGLRSRRKFFLDIPFYRTH
jgi:hypothetical protein